MPSSQTWLFVTTAAMFAVCCISATDKLFPVAGCWISEPETPGICRQWWGYQLVDVNGITIRHGVNNQIVYNQRTTNHLKSPIVFNQSESGRDAFSTLTPCHGSLIWNLNGHTAHSRIGQASHHCSSKERSFADKVIGAFFPTVSNAHCVQQSFSIVDNNNCLRLDHHVRGSLVHTQVLDLTMDTLARNCVPDSRVPVTLSWSLKRACDQQELTSEPFATISVKCGTHNLHFGMDGRAQEKWSLEMAAAVSGLAMRTNDASPIDAAGKALMKALDRVIENDDDVSLVYFSVVAHAVGLETVIHGCLVRICYDHAQQKRELDSRFAVSGTLEPIMECTSRLDEMHGGNAAGDMCRSWFGYRLDGTTQNQHRPISETNTFTVSAFDRGQPIYFQPGEHRYVFSVVWNCSDYGEPNGPMIAWKLDTVAVANRRGPMCRVGCDGSPGSDRQYDRCGVCGGTGKTCGSVIRSSDSFRQYCDGDHERNVVATFSPTLTPPSDLTIGNNAAILSTSNPKRAEIGAPNQDFGGPGIGLGGKRGAAGENSRALSGVLALSTPINGECIRIDFKRPVHLSAVNVLGVNPFCGAGTPEVSGFVTCFVDSECTQFETCHNNQCTPLHAVPGASLSDDATANAHDAMILRGYSERGYEMSIDHQHCDGDVGECDDGHPCTVDVCVCHFCMHRLNEWCCEFDEQCPQPHDACEYGFCDLEINRCDVGVRNASECCSQTHPCEPSQSICTERLCVDNQCRSVPIDTESPCCETVEDCPQYEGLDAICTYNECSWIPIPGFCINDTDCIADHPCMQHECIENQCYDIEIVGCCTDNDGCAQSTDVCIDVECIEGQCTNTTVDMCCHNTTDCPVSEFPCANYECTLNRCILMPVGHGCCTDDAECSVSNTACITGVCDQQQCTYDCVPGCCTSDYDCGVPSNLCLVGTCNNQTSTCNVTEIDCDDGDGCTIDSCRHGQCIHIERVCDSDNNECTADMCINDECVHIPTPDVPGCCGNNATDCDIPNSCYTAECIASQCIVYPVEGGCCHNDTDCESVIEIIPPCTIRSCIDQMCIIERDPACCFSDNECTQPEPGLCLISQCASNNTCIIVHDPMCCNVPDDCPVFPPDFCLSLIDCVGGLCQYESRIPCCNSDQDCAYLTEGSDCFGAVCNNNTGTCELVDLCPPCEICNTTADCHPQSLCVVATCFNSTCMYEDLNCDDGKECSVDACADGICVHTNPGCIDVCDYQRPPPPTLLLNITYRDFNDTFPDMEWIVANDPGAVEYLLGMDGTPVYANGLNPTASINSNGTFAYWFHDSPISDRYDSQLSLTLLANTGVYGLYDFGSSSFFPLDGMLFGNQARPHNYHFTGEIHTTYTYIPGDQFVFASDDDLWVFLDGQLVIDLGGVHAAVFVVLDFDTLGLVPNATYALDLFFAERHVVHSQLFFQTRLRVCEPSPSATPTRSMSYTRTPTTTTSPSISVSSTISGSYTPCPSPSPNPTNSISTTTSTTPTPSQSSSATFGASPTQTPANTPTQPPSVSYSQTPVSTASQTPSTSYSQTPSQPPSTSYSQTNTNTPTPTGPLINLSFSQTPTGTPCSLSPTPTRTPTPTPTYQVRRRNDKEPAPPTGRKLLSTEKSPVKRLPPPNPTFAAWSSLKRSWIAAYSAVSKSIPVRREQIPTSAANNGLATVQLNAESITSLELCTCSGEGGIVSLEYIDAGSAAIHDKCGVCGGDGKSCHYAPVDSVQIQTRLGTSPLEVHTLRVDDQDVYEICYYHAKQPSDDANQIVRIAFEPHVACSTFSDGSCDSLGSLETSEKWRSAFTSGPEHALSSGWSFEPLGNATFDKLDCTEDQLFTCPVGDGSAGYRVCKNMTLIDLLSCKLRDKTTDALSTTLLPNNRVLYSGTIYATELHAVDPHRPELCERMLHQAARNVEIRTTPTGAMIADFNANNMQLEAHVVGVTCAREGDAVRVHISTTVSAPWASRIHLETPIVIDEIDQPMTNASITALGIEDPLESARQHVNPCTQIGASSMCTQLWTIKLASSHQTLRIVAGVRIDNHKMTQAPVVMSISAAVPCETIDSSVAGVRRNEARLADSAIVLYRDSARTNAYVHGITDAFVDGDTVYGRVYVALPADQLIAGGDYELILDEFHVCYPYPGTTTAYYVPFDLEHPRSTGCMSPGDWLVTTMYKSRSITGDGDRLGASFDVTSDPVIDFQFTSLAATTAAPIYIDVRWHVNWQAAADPAHFAANRLSRHRADAIAKGRKPHDFGEDASGFHMVLTPEQMEQTRDLAPGNRDRMRMVMSMHTALLTGLTGEGLAQIYNGSVRSDTASFVRIYGAYNDDVWYSAGYGYFEIECKNMHEADNQWAIPLTQSACKHCKDCDVVDSEDHMEPCVWPCNSWCWPYWCVDDDDSDSFWWLILIPLGALLLWLAVWPFFEPRRPRRYHTHVENRAVVTPTSARAEQFTLTH